MEHVRLSLNKKTFQSKANRPFANRWMGYIYEDKGPPVNPPPPPGRWTVAIENITFLQTTYAGRYKGGGVPGYICQGGFSRKYLYLQIYVSIYVSIQT